MDQDVPYVNNIQSYHNHFREMSTLFSSHPVENRSPNNKTCYILFLLITAAFLGIGYYYIHTSDMKSVIKASVKFKFDAEYIQLTKKLHIQNLRLVFPILAALIGLAVVLAAAFLCLSLVLPTCVFTFMLLFGFLSIVGVTGIMYYLQAFVTAIMLSVLVVFLGLVLVYSYRKIKAGIALVEQGSKFIKQKLSLLMAPFLTLILVLSFQSFWVMSFVGIVIKKSEQSDGNFSNKGMIVLWVFLNLFYLIFFYYCLSFVIGTAGAIWYYGLGQNYLFKAIQRIVRYHLGSIVTAVLLIPFTLVGRRCVYEGPGSTVVCCCTCICVCCMKKCQNTLQTLNHNAIITMSVTGQEYYSSAQSAMSLIFENLPLFHLIDSLSNFIKISGAIFIAGVSAILGFVLLNLSAATNPDDKFTQIVGVIVLLFYGLFIGVIVMGTLSQSLSTIFLLYCIDQKFYQMGYPAHDLAPASMKNIFNNFVPYMGGDYNQNYGQSRINNRQDVHPDSIAETYVRSNVAHS